MLVCIYNQNNIINQWVTASLLPYANEGSGGTVHERLTAFDATLWGSILRNWRVRHALRTMQWQPQIGLKCLVLWRTLKSCGIPLSVKLTKLLRSAVESVQGLGIEGDTGEYREIELPPRQCYNSSSATLVTGTKKLQFSTSWILQNSREL